MLAVCAYSQNLAKLWDCITQCRGCVPPVIVVYPFKQVTIANAKDNRIIMHRVYPHVRLPKKSGHCILLRINLLVKYCFRETSQRHTPCRISSRTHVPSHPQPCLIFTEILNVSKWAKEVCVCVRVCACRAFPVSDIVNIINQDGISCFSLYLLLHSCRCLCLSNGSSPFSFTLYFCCISIAEAL